MQLEGKTVAVIGAGSSGLAAARLALSHGAMVTAFDSADAEKLLAARERFADIGVNLVCGQEAEQPRDSWDSAVLSPGIDLAWPIARAFAEKSGEVLGEIEFAYRFCPSKIIAITGTNGKTTTTELVDHMLRSAGKSSIAAGNIGLAFSEVVASEEVYEWVVLEVSSFQLETISRFRPDIAVWLNFAPDHMDRYARVEDYREAKLRLFLNADRHSCSILKEEDGLQFPGRTITFSAFSTTADWIHVDGGVLRHVPTGREFAYSGSRLHGKHNAENMMVALAVADQLGIDWVSLQPALQDFRASRHRCEKVAERDGVTYLNDSKATNLHALESALRGQDQPVVLIVGGKNKGLDYRSLTETVVRGARQVVCMGEIGPDIYEMWSEHLPCHLVGDMEAAVRQAASLAAAGDVVLFSPGTSSFDQYTGYGARGDAFCAAVEALG